MKAPKKTHVIAPVGAASPLALTGRKLRQQQREELRAAEWAMHLELMAAARAILKNLSDNPQKAPVADLVRLVELASRIGRLSTEPDGAQNPGDGEATVMFEFHAALRKVYASRTAAGRPLPVETIIDVTPAPPSTGGAV